MINSPQKLIVGLGNPGKEYEYTRHNLGFLVLEYLAQANRFKFEKSPITEALSAQGKIADQDVLLLWPLTYVNLSGNAVAKVLEKKEIPLSNLIVVCDDVNLDFGQIRLRPGGQDGGHNGLTSIIEALNTKDFARLRLGVGLPGPNESLVDFVLGEFSRQEKDKLPLLIQEAAECVTLWIVNGLNQAMSQFNKRKDHE